MKNSTIYKTIMEKVKQRENYDSMQEIGYITIEETSDLIDVLHAINTDKRNNIYVSLGCKKNELMYDVVSDKKKWMGDIDALIDQQRALIDKLVELRDNKLIRSIEQEDAYTYNIQSIDNQFEVDMTVQIHTKL